MSPSTSLRTERSCPGSEFSGTKVNAMDDCPFARLPRRTEGIIHIKLFEAAESGLSVERTTMWVETLEFPLVPKFCKIQC